MPIDYLTNILKQSGEEFMFVIAGLKASGKEEYIYLTASPETSTLSSIQ